MKERYAYSAYGTPTITDAAGTALTTSAENNCYTYTGREYEEALALYHYRARMYDPSAVRFCSRDPIKFGGGINSYRNHCDVGLADPTGLMPCLTETNSYEFDMTDNPIIDSGLKIGGKILPLKLTIRQVEAVLS